MSEISLPKFKSEFLNRLRQVSETSFDGSITARHLQVGQEVLADPAVIDRIIFPASAIISVEYCVDENSCAELVTVGREGFIGVSWISGSDFMLGRCVVRQAGGVLEMDLKTFSKMLQQSPAAKQLCDRYLLYRMACMAQRTACRMNHTVLQRMSQKLLVWEDRNGNRGQFPLTHKNLANMLGIHRATASEHLSRLQSLELISYSHGQVTIRNRDQLMKKSCGCYGIAQDLYRRLVESPSLRSYAQRW